MSTQNTCGSIDLAVIGGTGFYEIEGLEDVHRISVDTPYGKPSSEITVGTLHGTRVAFLARHGDAHTLLPAEVPSRANIWALASLGVTRVVSVSAVGSLSAEVGPRHMLVPDQLIDNTKGQRPGTFFGEGVVAHISFAEPFCRNLSSQLIEAGRAEGTTIHDGGTLVVIDGPAFSTRAESQRYRWWGAKVIGMTAAPEAKLAREAGMHYATLACVTDYDTWHDTHASVTVDQVIENLRANTGTARAIVHRVLSESGASTCVSCGAQAQALLTPQSSIPAHRQQDLAPILARYAV